MYLNRNGFEIGCRFNLNFNSDQHLLQGEYSIDNSSASIKFSAIATANTAGLAQDSFKTYSSGGIGTFSRGFLLPRFSVAYGRRLTKANALQKVWLLTEISLRHSYGNRASIFYDTDSTNNSVYYHNNASIVSTDYRAEIYKGYSGMLGIGLKTDFSIRIKQRKIYLGTIDFCFRQGLKTIGYLSRESIINDNGQLIGFINSVSTKGSGFYFQFGRNFQIHPWKKANANEQKKKAKDE